MTDPDKPVSDGGWFAAVKKWFGKAVGLVKAHPYIATGVILAAVALYFWK
jgi:hypothetical protein